MRADEAGGAGDEPGFGLRTESGSDFVVCRHLGRKGLCGTQRSEVRGQRSEVGGQRAEPDKRLTLNFQRLTLKWVGDRDNGTRNREAVIGYWLLGPVDLWGWALLVTRAEIEGRPNVFCLALNT